MILFVLGSCVVCWRSEEDDKDQFDKTLQSEWFMPDEFKNLDIENYVIGKCKNPEEIVRVESINCCRNIKICRKCGNVLAIFS